MRDLLDGSTVSEAIDDPDGRSGGVLERVMLRDGRRAVLKRVVREHDWISMASRDPGRVVDVFERGLFDQMPDAVDHTIIAAERTDDGWLVLMNDVSDAMIPPGTILSRAEAGSLLAGAAAIHAAFAGRAPQDLCPLADRLGVFGSRTTAMFPDEEVPAALRRGWALFAEIAGPDMARAVHDIVETPDAFAARLLARPCTLLHGDLKLGNLGLAGGRVVMVDWGSWTGAAPASVDFTWFLAVNGSRIAATRDELVDDWRAICGPAHDEEALDLSLVAGLASLGWDKAIHATTHPDPAIRQRELDDLAWWIAASRNALDRWAPI